MCGENQYEKDSSYSKELSEAVYNLRRKSKRKNVGVIVGPISAAVVVMVLVVVFYFFRRCQNLNGRAAPSLPAPSLPAPSLSESQRGFCDDESSCERDDDDIGEINSFNLRTIQVATNNFSSENKLGEGGYGPVYKGVLEDGREIAVKRLSRNSGQGLTEFKTEVQLIVKLQHKNLVRLLGCCVQGFERLLVYEFMPNNSLESLLFDANKSKDLDWPKRANIVIGIAKGLRYLHEDSRLKIIHRDLKTSNILLDNDMNSKISDFGTARIFGGNQTEAATKAIIGTYGYMAPEYAMGGIFSTNSDVYSFGVMLLEIISGQRNNCSNFGLAQNLLHNAWHLWNDNKGEQLIDGRMEQVHMTDNVLRWINIALLCVQEDPQKRPTMSTVVFMLEDQWSGSLPSPSEPPLSYLKLASGSEQTMTTTARPAIDIINDFSTTSTFTAS
ncbi:hypothetical protein QVD17_17910 [Tagetes erecta]|uniref:non-specific serine/threonine protein kinase n=1 Tax=Tagetes erecta TaxID=13708 RepID=A0AAD8KGJ6_TARER|nr:hypothetical protein QVD17_17910 [Tagetes erecta]